MSEVVVHIYDLSKGHAAVWGSILTGKHIDGVWHTGIVVNGAEYFYGSHGISSCAPGGVPMLGAPSKIEKLGTTDLPKELFEDYLHQLSTTSFRPRKYHLLDHNCNHFSNTVAEFLTGKHIPSYIIDLPNDVLATPIGAFLRQLADQMADVGTPVNSDEDLTGGYMHRQRDEEDEILLQEAAQLQKELEEKEKRRNEAKPENPDDEDSNYHISCDISLRSPVVFAKPDAKKIYHSLQNRLSGIFGPDSGEVFSFLDDIYAFVATGTCEDNLGLSRSHMVWLGEILLDDDSEVPQLAKLDLLKLFQLLAPNSAFASLLRYSQDQPILLYINSLIDSGNKNKKCEIRETIKALCNSCASHNGYLWLASKDQLVPGVDLQTIDLILKLVELALDDKELIDVGSVLLHNISVRDIDDDSTCLRVAKNAITLLSNGNYKDWANRCVAESDPAHAKNTIADFLTVSLAQVFEYSNQITPEYSGQLKNLKWEELKKCCSDKKCIEDIEKIVFPKAAKKSKSILGSE